MTIYNYINFKILLHLFDNAQWIYNPFRSSSIQPAKIVFEKNFDRFRRNQKSINLVNSHTTISKHFIETPTKLESDTCIHEPYRECNQTRALIRLNSRTEYAIPFVVYRALKRPIDDNGTVRNWM